MNLYLICVSLHLLALSLWLGHMFIWSLVVGPAVKRVQPQETADLLREASLFRGGLAVRHGAMLMCAPGHVNSGGRAPLLVTGGGLDGRNQSGVHSVQRTIHRQALGLSSESHGRNAGSRFEV